MGVRGFVAYLVVGLGTGLSSGAHAVDMPPVSYTGSVGYRLVETKALGDEVRSWRNLLEATVKPSTYIYAPWLVSMDSSLTLTEEVGIGRQGSSTQSISGTIGFDILPLSKYPAQIRYTRYNRFAELESTTSEALSDSLEAGLQLFLADDWSFNNKLRYDLAESDGFDGSTLDVLIEMDKQFEDFGVRASLNHLQEEIAGPSTQSTETTDTLIVRTNTKLLDNLSTSGITSLQLSTDKENRSSRDSVNWQGVTTATWQPEFLDGITIHGAFRSLHLDQSVRYDETSLSETTVDNAFLALSTAIPVSRGLSVSLGVNGGHAQSEAVGTGRQDTSLGANVGLSYSSTTSSLLGFNWNWFGSSTAAISSTTQGGVGRNETLRLGHTLSAPLPWIGENVRFSVSQAAGGLDDDKRGFGTTLNHSASLSQSVRDGRTWDLVQFRFSDIRRMGDQTTGSQLANLQFNRGYALDRFSRVDGNVSAQLSRELSGGVQRDFNDTVHGGLSYSTSTAFGIPGLGFNTSLTIVPPSFLMDDGNDQLGDQYLTNNFSFSIGNLQMNLANRISFSGSDTGEFLMFRVRRVF